MAHNIWPQFYHISIFGIPNQILLTKAILYSVNADNIVHYCYLPPIVCRIWIWTQPLYSNPFYTDLLQIPKTVFLAYPMYCFGCRWIDFLQKYN